LSDLRLGSDRRLAEDRRIADSPDQIGDLPTRSPNRQSGRRIANQIIPIANEITQSKIEIINHQIKND
jgi:hypothetical protein